jgi:hypothetical protein
MRKITWLAIFLGMACLFNTGIALASASVSGTTVTNATAIITDAQGNTWMLCGREVMENGKNQNVG